MYCNFGGRFSKIFSQDMPTELIKLIAVPEAGYDKSQDPDSDTIFWDRLFENQDCKPIS